MWISQRIPVSPAAVSRHRVLARLRAAKPFSCVRMDPLKSTADRDRDGAPDEIGMLARVALALTEWTERWIPDAFIFALLATLLVVGAAVVATPTPLPAVVDSWGRGFWELIPFTMQMSMVIITGYVLASAPPMRRLIRMVATCRNRPKRQWSPWPSSR